ncbi:MAG: hypothetical protein O3B21_11545 [Proteobacteria bacterium]|nr:hypothetical protein [Pseudomonadota bacterium]MDA1355107.1 hypothetical protein [Pseudomonadota bacterium]
MPDVLDTVKKWMGQLVEVGMLLIALGIVLQILFGRTVAFLPGDIVGNITRVVGEMGDDGLAGLIALGIVIWLFWRRKTLSS